MPDVTYPNSVLWDTMLLCSAIRTDYEQGQSEASAVSVCFASLGANTARLYAGKAKAPKCGGGTHHKASQVRLLPATTRKPARRPSGAADAQVAQLSPDRLRFRRHGPADVLQDGGVRECESGSKPAGDGPVQVVPFDLLNSI